MTSDKSKQQKPIHHTLKEFLFTLSYWGSWTRALLFFVLVSLMLSLALSGTSAQLTSATQHFWYTTLSVSSVIVYSLAFFAYDAAYVTLSRKSPLKHRLDRFALFVAESVVVVSVFSIWLVYAGDVNMTTVYIAVFGALLLLPIRAIVGALSRGK